MNNNEKKPAQGEPWEKFRAWLDNYWYHYKWHTVWISFALLVAIVGMFQMCSKGSVDIYIMYAGPYKFGVSDTAEFESAFNKVIDDRDGDGIKNTQLVSLYILSDEQVQGEVSRIESDGGKAVVNYSSYKEEFENFQSMILGGDTVICLLDPWLYESVKSAGGFMPLSEVLGYTPVKAADEYSIRITDSKFGDYFTFFDALPKDTLLCIRRLSTFSFLKGQARTEEYHAENVELFTRLMEFEIE